MRGWLLTKPFWWYQDMTGTWCSDHLHNIRLRQANIFHHWKTSSLILKKGQAIFYSTISQSTVTRVANCANSEVNPGNVKRLEKPQIVTTLRPHGFNPFQSNMLVKLNHFPNNPAEKRKENENLWNKQPKESVRMDLVGWVQPLWKNMTVVK